MCIKKEEVDWLWNHGKDGKKTEHGHCQVKEGQPHLGPEGLLVCQSLSFSDYRLPAKAAARWRKGVE